MGEREWSVTGVRVFVLVAYKCTERRKGGILAGRGEGGVRSGKARSGQRVEKWVG